jgi:hypothetical protein
LEDEANWKGSGKPSGERLHEQRQTTLATHYLLILSEQISSISPCSVPEIAFFYFPKKSREREERMESSNYSLSGKILTGAAGE